MSAGAKTTVADRIDLDLIARAQAGEAGAVAELVYRAQPHVRRFAGQWCVSAQDAEDAAQEALLTLYRRIGTLRAAAALGSWLFRIVRHECLRRARTALRLGEPEDAATVSSAEDEALRRLDSVRVAAAIGRLPDNQRRVVLLRDVLGRPGPEVAATLGIGVATMKSHLHRGRSALRADPDLAFARPGPASA
ncbi:RNA polymerase sigma factor [Nocardia thailandica]|uniref:RNA polymerase sigma factor n=1 Tax=Nocardia thailandica TaxID=257275 RepID=A0ABW6PXC6_9NOCA